MTGNWTREFDHLMDELRVAIVTVNSTRVDVDLARTLASWFSTAVDHLKEWVGLGALLGLMALVSRICLWCFCQIRLQQRQDAAMIAQAF